MNLPNYFIADLPHAELTSAMVTETCQELKRNRAKHLAPRSTADIINLLGELGENWRHADFPFRKLALEQGPAATSFSRATLERGLDSFFRELTADNLEALVVQELGHAHALDKFVSAESHARRAATARGPELLAHIAAGNIPNPTLMSIALGLLTRSAQFVKCARGAAFLPRLFAHSLHDADKKIAGCLDIAEWRGGNAALEAALFAEADCVTATGGDDALAAIRSRLSQATRFLGYGHRVSFAFITAEAFAGGRLRATVERAAADVTAWDQQGCLSPHILYVENGGSVLPEKFAELLAAELAARELVEPRGALPTEEAATIAARRGVYEVRAAADADTTRLWCSPGSTAWTVVFEADPRFQFSCLNRFIYVKSVKDLAEALQHAEVVRGQVSTVGIGATESKSRELAAQLAAWSATRVCPLGRMQSPPLAWRHDGRPALGDLVRWTEVEA